MKACIFLLSCLCAGYFAAGQKTLTASVAGSVDTPPLQSLTITMLNEHLVNFGNLEDYKTGKVVPSYCELRVRCNFPWQVTAALNGNSVYDVYQNASPTGFISIKPANSSNYIPLTNSPVKILQSDNVNIENTYRMDVKVLPDLNFKDGVYDINLSFVLSAQ
ncbi:hypothetical protein [Taibaiella soli]|uniref:Uncharacterized protein n=1 Tax=Taibaiella soli TaxID=1649169 RepID=A0A2W2BML2_9BACT|nr:hypothetical protein [Taibaiella soli]PZF74686.1 hypothetical protein DN068_00365 [Taibaiella soli]